MYKTVLLHPARRSQLNFSIQHDPGEVLPWTVQYAGSGHYFLTAAEAVSYAQSRKWITAVQAEKILARFSEDLNEPQ